MNINFIYVHAHVHIWLTKEVGIRQTSQGKLHTVQLYFRAYCRTAIKYTCINMHSYAETQAHTHDKAAVHPTLSLKHRLTCHSLNNQVCLIKQQHLLAFTEHLLHARD